MRRYNIWSGNPKGTKEDPARCIAEVYPPGLCADPLYPPDLPWYKWRDETREAIDELLIKFADGLHDKEQVLKAIEAHLNTAPDLHPFSDWDDEGGGLYCECGEAIIEPSDEDEDREPGDHSLPDEDYSDRLAREQEEARKLK